MFVIFIVMAILTGAAVEKNYCQNEAARPDFDPKSDRLCAFIENKPVRSNLRQ